jgi:hypothetical protein
MALDNRQLPLHSQFVYSYANLVYEAVLGKMEGVDDDFIDDWISDTEKAAKPSRTTLLHDLIRGLCGYANSETAWDAAPYFADEVREMMIAARMRPPSWLSEEGVELSKVDRRSDVSDLADEAFDKAVVPSVFFILFSDRSFLHAFQRKVATMVGELSQKDHPDILQANGVLRRVPIPKWLKAGIFYRDRGQCQNCFKNLSGLGSPVSDDLHVDHIVPLAKSGSNDPTNFQLLCARCNHKKSSRSTTRIPTFTPYW